MVGKSSIAYKLSRRTTSTLQNGRKSLTWSDIYWLPSIIAKEYWSTNPQYLKRNDVFKKKLISNFLPTAHDNWEIVYDIVLLFESIHYSEDKNENLEELILRDLIGFIRSRKWSPPKDTEEKRFDFEDAYPSSLQ